MTSKKQDEALPEQTAIPGEPLPDLPDSAYSEDAAPLDVAEVDVVMVRPSRGAKRGDRRTVDVARAADLVRAGIAKYAS